MPYFISDKSMDSDAQNYEVKAILATPLGFCWKVSVMTSSWNAFSFGNLSARFYCLEGISELSYLFLLCLIRGVLTKKKCMRSLILRNWRHRNVTFDMRFPQR
jgi:hypothetical protein